MVLEPESNLQVEEAPPEITLQDLAKRMDMFGEQMNWLCENLASLFMFVNQVGSSGGGVRGLMKAMKNTPELRVEESADDE